jgi:cellulose synthase/poly-beta-1,6-N-acetylglucosamine synthase-like glycosyltransferase
MPVEFIGAMQFVFLYYFLVINTVYLLLNILSIPVVTRYMEERSLDNLPHVQTGFEPPISIIVPAYNEEKTIAASIRSLLQLEYGEYEVVVVNDGSKDETLQVLIREFNLIAFEEAYRVRLKTEPIRTIYYSVMHPNLRIIDKENGGKSDSLNAGINIAHFPLFCSIDADSILQRDSLRRIVRPFLEDQTTIACGGVIRVANGCDVRGGFLVKAGLPTNILALFQIVEYLRAFLFGRLGWTPLNAVLIISGAFGVFRKETVVEVGGYRTDTVGEDMELVVRLHRVMREKKRKYRISFVPDPICWTEAPEDLKTLAMQRMRWQRGLCESLILNRSLLFNPKAGTIGWLAFPFMFLFEMFGPVIEVLGYVIMLLSVCFGLISFQAYAAFMSIAIGFGVLLSVSSLLLEELSFHIYPRLGHVVAMGAAAVLENFGYRQINSIWRLMGLFGYLRKSKAKWGKMSRTATWQRAA